MTAPVADAAARRRADRTAGWVALVVAVAGVALVVFPALGHFGALRDDPFATPSVTEVTVKTTGAKGDRPKRTNTVGAPTARGGRRPRSTITERPARTTERTRLTKPRSESLFERALGNGGLLLLRLALVAAAAFLAGAVTQRIMLGQFAVKLGPVEVPGIPEAAAASKEAIEDLKAGFTRQIDALSAEVSGGLAERKHTTTLMAEALLHLRERVEALESDERQR